nr:uncharacterized protein LOC109193649 [Ipomoea batatas]
MLHHSGIVHIPLPETMYNRLPPRLSLRSPSLAYHSCSNSPANKRRNHRRENKIDAEVFQRVFEMLNDRSEVDGSSPLTGLPGFGRTPNVRQLRVTDSPFPLKDSEAEMNSQVDMDAEEFIRKFYTQLNQQSKKAALESPSPYHIRAR